MGEGLQILAREPFDPAQEVLLILQIAACVPKPLAMHVCKVNSQRRPDCVSELISSELVLPRKDLDPVDLFQSSFDRHAQPQCEVIDVKPAEFGGKGLVEQNRIVSGNIWADHRPRLTAVLELQQRTPDPAISVAVACGPLSR